MPPGSISARFNTVLPSAGRARDTGAVLKKLPTRSIMGIGPLAASANHRQSSLPAVYREPRCCLPDQKAGRPVTGNDPLNDPENFDWETWEYNQILAFERKQRVLKTISANISWRGFNKAGHLAGFYNAGGRKHLIEIVPPGAAWKGQTLAARFRVVVNGGHAGTAASVRDGASLSARYFLERPWLSEPASQSRRRDGGSDHVIAARSPRKAR